MRTTWWLRNLGEDYLPRIINDESVDEDYKTWEYIEKIYNCNDIYWYIQRFRFYFEIQNLLPYNYFHINVRNTNSCLTGDNGEITIKNCDKKKKTQQWNLLGGRRFIYHKKSNMCLTLTKGVVCLKKCNIRGKNNFNNSYFRCKIFSTNVAITTY